MKCTISTVLAIEAAIAGGSISLLENGVEIAGWIGDAEVLKAENLLLNVHQLMSANNVDLQDIDLVAASAGPGSFTGIRIGIATAMGLSNGLRIPVSTLSALEAMVLDSKIIAPNVIAALPVGRNAICVQSFDTANGAATALSPPQAIPTEALMEMSSDSDDTALLFHASLYETFNGSRPINFGRNIAAAIGRICTDRTPSLTEPLFVSKSF